MLYAVDVSRESRSFHSDMRTWRICINEEENSYGSRIALLLVGIRLKYLLHRDCPPHKDEQHADCAKKKHFPARKSCDDQRGDGSVEKAQALIAHVDSCFGKCCIIPNHPKNCTRVVTYKCQQREWQNKMSCDLRYEGVPRPLCKQAHSRSNEYTTSHSCCSEHVHPRLLGVLQFDLDRGLNLSHFGAHQHAVSIPFGLLWKR